MDKLIGRVMEKIDDDTLLMVISDHGFKSFARCMNLNAWLHQNGYLALKEGKTESGDWFEDVDWSRTRAYTMGLNGLYLNIKGREKQGIVDPAEAEALKEEIEQKLNGLVDPASGESRRHGRLLTDECLSRTVYGECARSAGRLWSGLPRLMGFGDGQGDQHRFSKTISRRGAAITASIRGWFRACCFPATNSSKKNLRSWMWRRRF